MTPRAIARELENIRAQLVKATRIDTRYRQYIGFAIMRLDQLHGAVSYNHPYARPKKGGKP